MPARRGPVLGVIGGGQLARMMVEAAIRLDVDIRILSPSAHGSAASIAPGVVLGDHDDPRAAIELAGACDVITFEHERTTASVLDALDDADVIVRPGPGAMRRASDKVAQRLVAAETGMAVAPHAIVADDRELRDAVAWLGLPVVAKSAQGGYDGRGVRWLRSSGDVDRLATALAARATAWVVEPELDIDAELAVQIARRPGGEVAVYPVVETAQRDGICVTVTAPARSHQGLGDELVAAARRVVEHLDLVGILAVEAFVVDGRLLLNELAPRPHNSGHYTIDACATSQFENHVRAVLDLPLGDPGLLAPAAVMANVIATGPTVASLHDITMPGGTTVHLYGKEPRAGRKVGHVTTLGSAKGSMRRVALATAAALVGPSLPPIVDRVEP